MRGSRGFALVWVCFVLVLLGAVSATAFFTALQSARAGRHAADGLTARLAVEQAVAEALAGWHDLGLDRLAVGTAVAWSDASTRTTVRRLGAGTAVVEATYRRSPGYSASWLVEPSLPPLPAAAILTVARLDPSLDSLLSGSAMMPDGWVCDYRQPNGTPAQIHYYESDATLDSVVGGWPALLEWASRVSGIADSITVLASPAELAVSQAVSGVIVGAEAVTLASGAMVRGIVFSRRRILLEAGSWMTGVLVAPEISLVAGDSLPVFRPSPCTARLVLAARVPFRPVPGLFGGLTQQQP
ncbi:MAG TPA: hypothetical protein VNL98_13630 [Gemmatimonadales bacterium]|nr:hypothetical protein [Gemmatimonadales bacterium]